MDRSARYLLILFLATTLTGCMPVRMQRPIRILESDWVTFGANPQRTNESPVSLSPPLEVAWEFEAAAGFGSGSPVAADSFVIVGTLNGEVQIVSSNTGASVGNFTLESAVAGAVLLDGINVIACSATGDRTIVSYDYLNGVVRWSKELGGIESSPLRFGSRIFVTTLGGVLYCLEKLNGEEVWKFETKQAIHSSPASDGQFVVFGCDDGYVYAVDIETGKLHWKYKTGGSVFAAPSIYGSRVFVGSFDNNFYSLNLEDGSLQWKFDAGAKVFGAPSFRDELVFFGAANGTLYALHHRDGSVGWRFNAGSVINTSPVVSGEYVYFGSLDKKVYALEAPTGLSKWAFDVKGRVKSSPIVWNEYLLVAAEDRSLFAFKTVGDK